MQPYMQLQILISSSSFQMSFSTSFSESIYIYSVAYEVAKEVATRLVPPGVANEVAKVANRIFEKKIL